MILRNATNTMLLWSPKSGDVLLQDWPEISGSSRTANLRSALACYEAVRKAAPDQRKTIIFIEAIHLIVRDGIDPQKLHKVLLGLEEYRDGCAYDIPGLGGN